MRLKPVAMNGFPRQTRHDYLLGGKYHIPKEIFVTALIYACQRTPEHSPETLAFKPERWLEVSDIPADKDAYFPHFFLLGKLYAIPSG
jgi:cytochrome P450